MSGAEIVALLALGLAVPGVIDVFIRAGQAVASKVSKDRKTKEYVSRLHVFTVSSGVDRMQVSIRQAQILLKDPTVEEADKGRLIDIFDSIKLTLKVIDDCAVVILGPDYPFGIKRRKALERLKAETSRFERLLDDFRDRIIALKDLRASESDLFLTEHDFQWIFTNSPPRMLNTMTFVREGRVSRDIKNVKKSEVRSFTYENKPYSTSNKTTIKDHMRILSQKLDAAYEGDPGILPILGFRDDTDEQVFQLIFVLPRAERDVQTLLSALEGVNEMPALNTRVDLCLQLAQAILHVHNVRLVHKSIRPDNIILFGPFDSANTFTDSANEKPNCRVYLLGWHIARSADDFSTHRQGEELCQRRVYQHPQRQRLEAEADYNMGHDIYSFGACVLEILRWEALVTQEQSEFGTFKTRLSPDLARMFDFLNLYDETTTRPSDSSDMSWMLGKPQNVQNMLLALNDASLPKMVGIRLNTLVSDCLTLVDNKAGDADGISLNADRRGELGNGVVEQVLKPLREILHAL